MLLNAEIREKSINTVAKVMVHAFCTFPFNLLSVYKVSFILLSTFRNMLRTTLLLQKLGRKITPQLLVVELQFLRSTLSLIISYLCINFYFISYVFIRRDIAYKKPISLTDSYVYRYAPDELIIANIRKGVTLLILLNRVRVLVFCTFSEGRIKFHPIPS